MHILGIDPGSRNCGYAIINYTPHTHSLRLIEAGIIKIKERDLQAQIMEFVEGIDLVIKSIHIDEVAIEDIFFAYNPQSVIKLAQFRGALSLKILQEIGNFAEYTPLQVKKAITGNGKADKTQVAFMVKRILGLKGEIKPLDITDAIAIAITHSQRIGANDAHSTPNLQCAMPLESLSANSSKGCV
ncbi:crossover junction endodeoxyribonuclease RuvC [Helicobacter sp. MIT 21-1697]|uniref:crossover junction endodeoxyribonuclease RuvC n=1 Tax=Helicobacter sp. MIT 21-1697 TaxID=2993733 RepID=UPI00224B86B7|nr:crossover junction endodeoxyribonuclease RuvC [Helicobacter sp. MIT 21-1697]MCX2717694.1 crossover junction endodeoxyribonuclease RuvC [Helicobacter sp. MIT 21-1697]